MKRSVILLVIFAFANTVFAQFEDFGFQRDLSVSVKNEVLTNLKNPWGGGLNSVQFSEIDLNFDGIKDLFIFDRSAFKVLTFINNGTFGSVDYEYAPQYAEKFPKLHDWVLLKDYNCDGKEDIFTYGVGSITLYKNISNPTDGIKFSLVTPVINSQQGPNLTNLLVTQVDLPGIADMDNDGDLDILTFFGLGTYVEYHRNLSMETYGNCDSIKYLKTEYCWGNMAENPNNNTIDLNITCPWSKFGLSSDHADKSGAKHTGSTILLEDMDGDGDKDVVLGDVDYPNVVFLLNGGDSATANIVSKDSLFPSYNQSLHLFSFPATMMIDLDNDGKKDFLASPFESVLNVADNVNSCWFYKNIGSSTNAVFEFVQKNILQDQMIETGAGAYPTLADYDGDGLMDLFIGNYGTYDSSYYSSGFLYSVMRSGIMLYKNIGSVSTPVFEFVTDDFAGIKSMNLIGVTPTFGDIDGDGDDDLIIGDSKGNLYRFENTAGQGSIMNMVYLGSMMIDVGDFSAPQLFDLNGDSLLDLIVGEKKGNLNFYKNTGTASNPVFVLETDSLGHIDIIDYSWSNSGYATPCFFKDSLGMIKLFVGSESGYIFYYKDIESNINGHFTLADSKLGFIYNGFRTSTAVGYLNADNYPDLISGNISGGLSYYKGVFPPHSSIEENFPSLGLNVNIYPNPSSDYITILVNEAEKNLKLSIEIYSYTGKLVQQMSLLQSSDNRINLSGFTEGIYFIRITSDTKKSVSKKLVIVK